MNFHRTKKLLQMVSHDIWAGNWKKMFSMELEILGLLEGFFSHVVGCLVVILWSNARLGPEVGSEKSLAPTVEGIQTFVKQLMATLWMSRGFTAFPNP